MRVVLSAVLTVHGLIHFMGFAKAFGLAELPQLTQPIARPLGLLWLLAGLLSVGAAWLPLRHYWVVGILAALLSQAVVLSSWSDAKFGTLPNVIAVLVGLYSFVAFGPFSLRAAFASDAAAVLQNATASGVLTDADLARLPAPVQQFVRTAGAVGQLRPASVRARWKGRIRGGASEPWMEFTAVQVNTYGAMANRLFFIDATMKGLPVDVYHRFVAEAATARVRLLSLVTMVDMRGPQMNRSETVTLFNDLCLLAPGHLTDPAIRWESIDATSARAFYTRGDQTISAVLRFDESGRLVDFVSEDRSVASKDGLSFTRQRWTTPLRDPRRFGSLNIASHGEARWHPPNAPDYAYVEMDLLELSPDGVAVPTI